MASITLNTPSTGLIADGYLNKAETLLGGLIISGTTTEVEAGQWIRISLTGVNSRFAQVQSDGTFSLSYSSFQLDALGGGAIAVSAAHWSTNSNSSGTSAIVGTTTTNSLSFFKDVSSPLIALNIPSVLSNAYFNAAEASSNLTITGFADGVLEGSLISIVIGEKSFTTPLNGDGEFTLTLTPSLLTASGFAQGSKQITATVSDAAGNPAVSDPPNISFIYDSVAPTVAITSVGSVGTTGVVSSVAGDATVVGTAEAGRVVTISSGANVLGTATANGSGAFTYTLTPENITTLAQGGGKSITAAQTDAAGNTGTSAPALFSIDTVAPTAPALVLGTGVTLGATSAEAVQASGAVTLTAELDSAVSVTFAGATSVVKTLTGTGVSQAVTLTEADLTALGDGPISVSATATDAAGNISTLGSATFTLDTVNPVVMIYRDW